MAERVGQPGKIRMGIPPQQLRDCANNMMVWLGPGDFPTTLPSCFRSPRTGRCGTTQSRPGSPGTPASRRRALHERTAHTLGSAPSQPGEVHPEMAEEEQTDRDDDELRGVDGHRVGDAVGS